MNNKILIAGLVGISVIFGFMAFVPHENRAGTISRNNVTVNEIDNAPASASFSGIASASSTLILSANPNRSFAVCTNIGLKTLWLGFGSRASISGGIAITPSSSYTIDQNNLWTGKVYARTTNTTTGKITCIEAD